MARDRASAMQSIASLLPKLDDPDPDIRFMQLNDLAAILSTQSSEQLRSDTHAAARVIDRIIKALTDSNGEVQNQALKCVGPLARRTPNDYIAPYFDKITELTARKELDASVPLTALRVVVGSLPNPLTSANERDIKEAFAAISRVLIPRLVGRVLLANEKRPPPDLSPGLLQQQKDKSYSADAVDVAIEVVHCYGSSLRNEELAALGATLFHTISDSQANGVVKKRALAGVSAIVPYYKTAQLTELVEFIAAQVEDPDTSINHRRYLISGVGSLARAIPTRIGAYLNVLAPFVLNVLSQEEMDAAREDSGDEVEVDPEVEELREATLVTLDSLLASCPGEMQRHLDGTLSAALRYLKYDPNVVDVEDDEEMSGTQDAQSDDGDTEPFGDDDDEYDGLDDDDAFGDVEDTSWKVRRSAAKVLLTLIAISTTADQEGLIAKLAPPLLSRLSKEREDSVRLEIISATTALMHKTASMPRTHRDEAVNGSTTTPMSNKRKRRDSNISNRDVDLQGLVHSRASPPFVPPSPPVGAQADLANLIPRIISATVKLWKKASIALKQAAILMLKAVAESRNGALADHLQQLEDPFADALTSSGGSGSTNASGSTATAASLQIETLALVSTITETNPSTVLMPFVIALISPVTSLVSDRNYKVSQAALSTMEQFAKALSPPRLPATNQDHAIHIEKLYSVTLGPVNNVNADLEVRHRAIQVFGVLVSRTSGTKLLSLDARSKALGVLDDRLKNETTRREAAQAIGLVAEAATTSDNVGISWVQEVSVELANQLRKADRSLRAASLEALQFLALNPVTASQYGTDTIQNIQTQLMPVIRADDLNLLTPALVVLAKIIPTNAEVLVNPPVVEALCKLSQAHLEGPPLKAYLLVIKMIGEQGLGTPLMTGLLAVGTNGDTHTLGRAIGTLMVHGGNNLGVSVDAFIGEVQNKDDNSACLALTVLGEIGLRMGAQSPFDMKIFYKSLSAKSDKVRLSAAIALGSASSSDIKQYLPAVLRGVSSGSDQEYLHLHSLKEILQHTENSASSIMPYTQDMWTVVFAVAAKEDNQAVGAECLGRVVLLDPAKYLQELHQALDGQEASQRGTVISAFRFTLSNSSSSLNQALTRSIVPLLKKMLSDSDIGNRRLAVTTLTAALQNKPEFILPDLDQLLPVVLADTHIKKELIKTVRIGPFTHQEDAGLDLRKSAFAALYTLMETPRALPFLTFSSFFDRIVDGVADDHDIRTLCNLMLSRLSDLDAEETKRRLPTLAESFRKVLDQKPKENAVKQEIERINEANSSVIRMSLELGQKFPSANNASVDSDLAAWRNYFEFMQKEFAGTVKQITTGNDA
ncbi:hypothetical protein LTR05_004704 [Lithohypha guttulata]|uniref:TATA-binding protein interacting (TIP20) domain-containing protein n=1 Tax=Lithohypha guttulata TaxID=1690604 RepID=A0AAN7T0N1_9EURO|nr:hypothetical protein LTR05_004704 [Lithohypha guttulata]